MACIPDIWRKLSGENNWKGLLNPLDITLRRYIIHYGEMAGAIFDAFNIYSKSKRFAIYAPEHFFSKVGLQNNNPFKYQVTNYFYARAEVKIPGWVDASESSLMGYVAVATDEGKLVLGRRDILIAWMGTVTFKELEKDFEAIQVSASDVLGKAHDPKVHKGFYSMYTSKGSDSEYTKTSARDQVLKEVRKLVDKYQNEELSITVTGHSLGAALATLNGMDIVANEYNKPTNQSNKACLVTVFPFACPRVGDEGFKKTYSELSGLHILRVRNKLDFVPDLPPSIIIPPIFYCHVGEELTIDSNDSPHLKKHKDVKEYAHDLEVYLHIVAGTHGSPEDFNLVVNRSVALVNKHSDALNDDHDIPTKWGVEKNKNMIQLDDGSWVLNDYVADPPSES